MHITYRMVYGRGRSRPVDRTLYLRICSLEGFISRISTEGGPKNGDYYIEHVNGHSLL